MLRSGFQFADAWAEQTCFALDVLPAEAAFIAHERTLSECVFARSNTVQSIFFLVDMNAATGATALADTVLSLQPPDAFLV